MQISLPTLYSQLDNRWANTLLGYNTSPDYNIYNYGCVITCLAMVSVYYGKPNNPFQINEKLKNINGFKDGGYYVWGSFPKLVEGLQESMIRTPHALTDQQIDDIKNAIDKGFPVMIGIDYNPKTVKQESHYVLIIAYDKNDENNFTIADPIVGGNITTLKKYLGWFRPSARKTIEQVIIYAGKPLSNEAELQKQIANLTKSIEFLKQAHIDELANYKADCQERILQVKEKLMEVANNL